MEVHTHTVIAVVVDGKQALILIIGHGSHHLTQPRVVEADVLSVPPHEADARQTEVGAVFVFLNHSKILR